MMAWVFASTNRRDGAGRLSMASPAIAQSSLAPINDNEPGARSVFAPLADYHFQFVGADAPRQRPVSLSLLPRGTGQHLPGCAFVAAPGLLIHAVKLTLGLVFHLPSQTVSQFLTGRRVIHQSCLSKVNSRSGSTDSRRELSWNANSLCIWSKK